MPRDLRRDVDARVEEGGFGNVSEYFRHLIRQDLDDLGGRRRRMRVLIREGEESGPPIAADEKFWKERFHKLRSAVANARRKAG